MTPSWKRNVLLGGKYKNNRKAGQARRSQASLHQTTSSKRQPSHPTYRGNTSITASTSPCSATPSTSPRRLPPSKSKGTAAGHTSSSHRPVQTSAGNPSKVLAIDCEMVGTGPKGKFSMLARCSIVSYDGDVVYDKYINPSVPVTDYRTRWSGIRRNDLVHATPFSVAKKEIVRLITGKVVVGHAIHNDFKVLHYSHPRHLTRDTSKSPLLNRKAGFHATECVSLKRLTKALFNLDIQTGKIGHSSVEDARATMKLYRAVEKEWEVTDLK